MPVTSWKAEVVENAVEERKYQLIHRERVEGAVTMVLGNADPLHAW